MSDPKFVEFAGKNPKEYKCPRCKAVIKYAKFFGSDGKLLTTDGKEPWFDREKRPMSNTGWMTNADKTMHECEKKPLMPNESEIIDKSLLSQTFDKTVELSHTPQPKDFDSLLMKNAEDEAYQYTKLTLAYLRGVRRACKEEGIEDPPVQGMVFNKTMDRMLRRDIESG